MLLSVIARFIGLILGIEDAESFPPPLTKEEEFELFRRAAGGDSAARSRIIEHNLRLVPHVIKKYYSTYEAQDELVSVGSMGLIKAADSFKYEYGTRFALIQSSSFLFCSNGFRWGMDIAFRGAYRLANTPKQAATLLADLELMVISHGHSDHFEERTVRALAQNPTKWVIPDFLEEQAISYGISREKMIIAHAGETLRVGPLTIRPFPGRHFRPVTGKGIEEYGYHISVDGGPAMAFPVDTRDFALRDMPKLPPANYCFANVWLGDSCGNTADYGERPSEFARFMLHFSAKNILFAHLYECDRKEKDMWREEHAALLAKTISQMNPDTRTLIPCPGEIYKLS